MQQSAGWQPGNNRLTNWDWWLVAVFHGVSASYPCFFLALFSICVFNSVVILSLMWKNIYYGTCHTHVHVSVVCVWIVWSARQELHLAVYMFNVCHNRARFQIIKLITTRASSVTTIMLSCSYEVFKAFLLCSWEQALCVAVVRRELGWRRWSRRCSQRPIGVSAGGTGSAAALVALQSTVGQFHIICRWRLSKQNSPTLCWSGWSPLEFTQAAVPWTL